MSQLWVVIWFVLALFFIIAEIVGPAFSFFGWFGVGAIIAGIIAYKNVFGPEIQIAVFVLISVLLVLATKPLQKKLLKNKDGRMDTKERIIGKKVQVAEDINNLKDIGKVFLEGSYWKAKSYSDDVQYKKDDVVTVIDVEGIILIVK